MKISKRELRRIIREEKVRLRREDSSSASRNSGSISGDAGRKSRANRLRRLKEQSAPRPQREGRLLEYASAPTRDELTVDISNIMIELQEIVDVNANGQTETPDMGGPDIGQNEEVADFVGDAIVNLERALSVLSVEGV